MNFAVPTKIEGENRWFGRLKTFNFLKKFVFRISLVSSQLVLRVLAHAQTVFNEGFKGIWTPYQNYCF